MAITSSAKKAIRASERKHVFNIRRKNTLSDAAKAFKKAIAKGDAKEAAQLLPAAYKAVDKAAKSNVIPKNTANRKKARLAAALKKFSGK